MDGKVVSADRVVVKVYRDIMIGDKFGNRRSYVGIAGETFSIPCSASFDEELGTFTESQQIYWLCNGQRIAESKSNVVKYQTCSRVVPKGVNQKNTKVQANPLSFEFRSLSSSEIFVFLRNLPGIFGFIMIKN